jgi:hypothetical protein
MINEPFFMLKLLRCGETPKAVRPDPNDRSSSPAAREGPEAGDDAPSGGLLMLGQPLQR